jgi:hypothetical protein
LRCSLNPISSLVERPILSRPPDGDPTQLPVNAGPGSGGTGDPVTPAGGA